MKQDLFLSFLTFMLENSIITFEEYNDLYMKALPFLD